MGVVYRAWQVSLKRPVALKMIIGAVANWEDLRREAEAAAKLTHPGIVPIYQVGEIGGRHYFAMGLVNGGSLSEQLDHYRKDFRSAARLVAAVARAVHHAHGRLILHCDLKPGNILLDEEGQPHVSDFGLAKRLEPGGAGSLSRGGGTPGYMAPEQAAGQGPLTTAVDVYGVGAILYVLLTGRPPFEEPLLPRSLNPQVPKDLTTICLKCLHKDPDSRYDTADALADDLERWLRGEPIQARPVPRWERALLWARRRPAAATLLGFTAAVVLALAVGGPLWARREANRAKENEALRKAAERERDEKNASLKLAAKAVDEFSLKVLRNPQIKQLNFEGLQEDLLKTTVRYYEEIAKRSGDDPDLQADQAKAHGMLGEITAATVSKEAAIPHYQEALKLFNRLAADHPDDPRYERHRATTYEKLGLAYRDLNQLEKAEDAFRESLAIRQKLVADHPSDASYRNAQAMSHGNLANLLADRGQFDKAEEEYKAALRLFAEAASADRSNPDYRQDLAATHSNLGVFYWRHSGKPDRLKLTENAFDEALKIREALVRDYLLDDSCKYHLAVSHNNFSNFYQVTGRWNKAATASGEAVKLLRDLVRRHRTHSLYRRELGASLNTIGLLYADTDHPADAEKALLESVQVLSALVDGDPTVARHQQEFAKALANLGELYRKLRRMKSAEEHCKHAVRIQKRLFRAQPSVPEYRQELAKSYNTLGNIYRATGRMELGECEHLKALALRRDLIQQFQKVPDYQNDLAASHTNLGILYNKWGRPREAEKHYRLALDIRAKLADDWPRVTEYARKLATAHNNFGNFYAMNGHPDQAEAEYRSAIDAALPLYDRAIEVLTPVLQKNPEDTTARERLYKSHRDRADALLFLERYEDALKDWEQALRLDDGSKRPFLRVDRAITLAHLGRHALAVSEAEELAAEAKKIKNPLLLLAAAAVFSCSSGAARADASLPAAERDSLAQRYAAAAVDLVRQAHVAGVFKDPAQLERLKGADFEPLRTNDDFKKLLQDLEPRP